MLKIGEFEVDENDRPAFPPKILSTEVVWNPFDDIIPREQPKVKEAAAAATQKALEHRPATYVNTIHLLSMEFYYLNNNFLNSAKTLDYYHLVMKQRKRNKNYPLHKQK